jgi:protein-tyrosine-phosphatase/DNA-binding transcriptional ArsR family regulator
MDTDTPFAPPSVIKMLANDLRWRIVAALARSDHRVQELVHLLNEPYNLVSYHLRQLRANHLVEERRSSADARDVYYSLQLEDLHTEYVATANALHPGLIDPDAPAVMSNKVCRVLILCTHNSARSQMAEALLRTLSNGRVEVYSAGSAPTSIHPDAVAVMATYDIDISDQKAKSVDQLMGQSFDYVITVCDRVREVCPLFPNDPERIHWSFADPAMVEDAVERREAFDKTARELTLRLRYLLALIERKRR